MVTEILSTEIGGHLVTATSVPDLNYFVTSSQNLSLMCWDASTFEKCQQLPCASIQVALAWSPLHQKCYSADISGTIHAWDLGATTTTSNDDHEPHIHVSRPAATPSVSITRLVSIDSMTSLAMACSDGRIRLLDLNNTNIGFSSFKTLSGHQSAVAFLDYAAEYRYLVSGGLDRSIKIWNPFMSGTIATLVGHRQPLVGVEAVPGTPDILSTDSSGQVKVWDIRMFRCRQTLSYEKVVGGSNDKKNISSRKGKNTLMRQRISSSVYLPGLNQLALGTREMTFVVVRKSVLVHHKV